MQRYRADVSEQDLLSAFDNAPVGMAVLTANGVITACNAAMGRLLERAPAELVGGTFFEVTHPDDLEEARRECALMQIEVARIVRHECRFVLPGDRIIWVSVSTAVTAAGGRGDTAARSGTRRCPFAHRAGTCGGSRIAG